MPNQLNSRQAAKIDDCTEDQLYDLLASLDVNVEKYVEKSASIVVLREKYRKMLRRQLRDFKFGDACMNPTWQELK
jgi:hypothetical protein